MVRIERFVQIDSTQLEARRRLAGGWPGGAAVLVAERQTGGLGRLGRAWSSPPGGLWMTLVVPMSRLPEALGVRVGVACCRAVRRVISEGNAHAYATIDPSRAVLKWPNDILVIGVNGAGKVLGVLTEIVSGHALIGVGCNVNNSEHDLPPEVQATAASLSGLLGCTMSVDLAREIVVEELLRAADPDLALWAWVREARTMLHPTGDVTGIGDDGEAIRG